MTLPWHWDQNLHRRHATTHLYVCLLVLIPFLLLLLLPLSLFALQGLPGRARQRGSRSAERRSSSDRGRRWQGLAWLLLPSSRAAAGTQALNKPIKRMGPQADKGAAMDLFSLTTWRWLSRIPRQELPRQRRRPGEMLIFGGKDAWRCPLVPHQAQGVHCWAAVHGILQLRPHILMGSPGLSVYKAWLVTKKEQQPLVAISLGWQLHEGDFSLLSRAHMAPASAAPSPLPWKLLADLMYEHRAWCSSPMACKHW